MHQLIRNDKTEKTPTVSVSSAPTFSPVLRPDEGHRGMDSPHSQTGTSHANHFQATRINFGANFSIPLGNNKPNSSPKQFCQPAIWPDCFRLETIDFKVPFALQNSSKRRSNRALSNRPHRDSSETWTFVCKWKNNRCSFHFHRL